MDKKYKWLLTSPIAHRGLLDKEEIENTAPAFEKCVKAGVPIETDLRQLEDGNIICFHDENPFRFCKTNIPFCEMGQLQVKKLKIKGNNKIVFLSEFLEIVSGKVPILFEIKSPFKITDDFVKIIKKYKGTYAFESFNPITVFSLKKRFSCPVGQLVSGSEQAPKTDEFKWKTVNFFTQPDFVSHNVDTLKEPYGLLPFIVWTVKTAEQAEKAKKFNLNYIFEGGLGK